MSDEVIAIFARTAAALKRPLFSFRHVSCSRLQQMTYSQSAPSFETHRCAMLLKDEVREILMVRSAALPHVSNHEAPATPDEAPQPESDLKSPCCLSSNNS
jgi:hypothetical protein